MGLLKSLKGTVRTGVDSVDAQDGHDGNSTKQEKRRLFGHHIEKASFDMSSSWSSQTRCSHHTDMGDEDFAPPPGPPPSHLPTQSEEVNPLRLDPTPPPAQKQVDSTEYAPPPGPPPFANPPPYHDWTVIPDTSLLPPPPSVPNVNSPTNNASYDSAARAHEWCALFPPYTPSVISPQLYRLVQDGDVTLEKPPSPPGLPRGDLRQLSSPGTWRCHTARRQQQDAIILSTLPLYFAAHDHPLRTRRPKIIYFELRVRSIADDESGIALGFAAKPYPPWRLPGWHRASIGVHGDDGRRYVNDSWGGRDFVDGFRPGDVVGLGMRFGTESLGADRVKTKAFVTRNGRVDGEWDMDEERDAERDEGVEGLMGELDMYAAIGVFGGVEFDVRFRSEDWVFQPG